MNPLIWKALTLGPALAGCAVLALGTALAWRSRVPDPRCRHRPGPLWRRILLPWVGRCAYALDGLRPDAGGLLTCPECGGRCRADRVARHWAVPLHRRWWCRAGIALLLATSAAPATWWVRRGEWVEHLPDEAVLRVNEWLGQRTPRMLREALATRAEPRSLSPADCRRFARVLVEDLRSDDIPWNADQASWALVRLGPDALGCIEAALASPDVQQRELAAATLMRIDGYTYAPSDAFLRVLVSRLARAGHGAGAEDPCARVTDRLTEARTITELAPHAERVAKDLAGVLDGPNPRARLLAAIVAVHAGLDALRPRAVARLVAHLGDNDLEDDAVLATAALVRAGEAARDDLEQAAAKGDDPQQRRLAALILRRIVEPGSAMAQVPTGDPARITSLARDPTVLTVNRLLDR